MNHQETLPREDNSTPEPVSIQDQWQQIQSLGPQGIAHLLEVIRGLRTDDRAQRHTVARILAEWSRLDLSQLPSLTRHLSTPHIFLRDFFVLQRDYWNSAYTRINNNSSYLEEGTIYYELQQFSDEKATLAAWCLLRALLLCKESNKFRDQSPLYNEVQRITEQLLQWADEHPNATSLTNQDVKKYLSQQIELQALPSPVEQEFPREGTWDEFDLPLSYSRPLSFGKSRAKLLPKLSSDEQLWQKVKDNPEQYKPSEVPGIPRQEPFDSFEEQEEEEIVYFGASLPLADEDFVDLEGRLKPLSSVEIDEREVAVPQQRSLEVSPPTAAVPAAPPQELAKDKAAPHKEAKPAKQKKRAADREQPEEQGRQVPIARKRDSLPEVVEAGEEEATLLAWDDDSLSDARELDAEEMPVEAAWPSEDYAMAPKRSAGLGTFFKILFSPLLIPYWLLVGVGKVFVVTLTAIFDVLEDLWYGVRNFFRDQWWEWKQRAEEEGIRIFELFLSDDAGRPGLFERLFAQSRLLLKAIHHTLGVRFVLWVNAVDALVDMTVGYIAGIFEAWKTFLTLRRKVANRHQPIHNLAEDVTMGRLTLSRVFSFVGFYPEEVAFAGFPTEEEWTTIHGQTFALKLILDTRNKLDDMKRDLSLITRSQIQQTTQRSFTSFFLSWIPNPFQLLTAWKDLALMAMFMRYSRREVEKMYFELLDHYHKTLLLLQEQTLMENQQAQPETLQPYQLQLLDHEKGMYDRWERSRWSSVLPLEATIEKNRKHVQRLLQLLCHPIQVLDPQRWYRIDLLLEVLKMQQAECIHPGIALALETWLTKEVHKQWQARGYRPSRLDSMLMRSEALHRKQRSKLLKTLQNSWGPML